MDLLSRLAKQYKTISIVGMEKNTGKTTTLNYLIEEAMDLGMVLGVTSTGRDGENTDLVTGTEKPRVFLDAGAIVSVPVQLYELSDAGLEILKMTRYSTALGQIMLCRVAESGYVQVAGPVNTKDHKSLCEEMFALGAQLILIDGAIDRKSIAAPGASDAIILATGAALSRSLKKVVEETLHVVRLYGLPKLPKGEIRDLLEKEGEPGRILLGKAGEVRALDLKTGLLAGKYLDEAVGEDTEWIFLPGVLTSGLFEDMNPGKLRKVSFILKDPTRIFIPHGAWQQLRKRGLTVHVLENITIAALSVNPYSPAGYSFPHETLLSAMREAVEGIPVIDVKYLKEQP